MNAVLNFGQADYYNKIAVLLERLALDTGAIERQQAQGIIINVRLYLVWTVQISLSQKCSYQLIDNLLSI